MLDIWLALKMKLVIPYIYAVMSKRQKRIRFPTQALEVRLIFVLEFLPYEGCVILLLTNAGMNRTSCLLSTIISVLEVGHAD